MSVTYVLPLKCTADEPPEFLESVGRWFDIVARPKSSPLCGSKSETSLHPEFATVTIASEFCFNGRAGKSNINGSIGSTSRKVWS